ncbi:hypothetical protein GCM10011374_37550 [Kocuria dechangensis]|uniref:Amino acid permease n=1 Tax=Kocuria dechangensis TaxID=1176249 RepID=A0A917H6E1_9MICC|nr:APC family permease [Kocuria dechangensis]GGG69592.1 hypothetical protein GCM10011374_37550 [Kocuria dechangensis]
MGAPEASAGSNKLTWNGTYCMAVGGMVGGGIFSVLGVVVELAGRWAWVAFLLAGVIAWLASLNYVALTTRWHQGAGSYGYLRRLHHLRSAGMLAWILVAGYVLTVSVYAFTFGHYLATVLGLSTSLWPRAFAVAIVVVLVLVNLRGVGDSQRLEEITVWAKLAILIGLAGIGLWRFEPANLSAGAPGTGAVGVLIGAASIFMAYEGFQLLTYDYDDIENADRILPRAVPPAVVTVTATYIIVALGAASLVGAGVLVEQKEVALAAAGEAAWGTTGLVVVTVGAVFATGSAINATLFATARLARDIAQAGDYPGWVGHTNGHQVPDRAVVLLGATAALLAAVGGLTTLVEAASLVFLVTFGVVGAIAWHQRIGHRAVAVLGCLFTGAAALVLTGRLALETPLALAALVGLVAVTLVVQPRIARRQRRS